MGFCPFLSGIKVNSDGSCVGVEKVSCVQSSECHLWDSVNNQCIFQSINEKLSTDELSIAKLAESINSKLFDEDDQMTITEIEKNSNKHLKSIDFHTRCGCSFSMSMSLLTNEFLMQKDLDGNGMIYGKDFKIKDDEAPPLLKAMTQNPFWEEPETEMSMSDYLGTVPTDDTDQWINEEYAQI